MGDKTGIQWTDASWNPTVGCSIVSPGCTHCYAMGEAARQIRCAAGMKRETHYTGTVETVKGRAVWTGKVNSAPDHIWEYPLRWLKPRRIFVNSMSDLFHEDIPDAWIDRAFAIMALCPQHTFQVLTKRADRMRAYVSVWFERLAVSEQVIGHPAGARPINAFFDWAIMPTVLPNVWLGVSTERQIEADERIPDLLATPAAIRFISAEPLLGPIYLQASHKGSDRRIDWVIVGGESSSSKAQRPRPMHPNWARDLRDQCGLTGIRFFFKQWGDWHPDALAFTDARTGENPPARMRVGVKKAGRLLDGREHNDFPNHGGDNGRH